MIKNRGTGCVFNHLLVYLYVFLHFLFFCSYVLNSKTIGGREGEDVHHFVYSCDYYLSLLSLLLLYG